MSRAIKLKNNDYIDSSGVIHDRKTLEDILDKPILMVYQNGNNQSFTSSVYQKVALGNIQIDTHNGFTPSNNTYTVKKTGYYVITAQTEFVISSTRRIVNRLNVSGNLVRYGIVAGINGSGSVIVSSIQYLMSGQTITVEAKVDGENASINANNISSYLYLYMI